MNVRGAAVSPELNASHGLDGSGSKQAPSIVLPHQEGTVDGIALDIGGSLVKLAHFVSSPDGGGKLRFEKFETSRIEECIDFIERKRLHRSSVKATGGGRTNMHSCSRSASASISSARMRCPAW